MGNTSTRESASHGYRRSHSSASIASNAEVVELFDGGSLLPQGIYTQPAKQILSSSPSTLSPSKSSSRSGYIAEYKIKIIQQLILSRRLAPFYKGLQDYDSDWSDQQLHLAIQGLPLTSSRPGTPRSTVPSMSMTEEMTDYLSVNDASNRMRALSLESTSSSRPGSSPIPQDPRPPRPRAATAMMIRASSSGPRQVDTTVYRGALECPICFLFYPPNMNYTRCCTQPICTECFLQIKRPAPHYPVSENNEPGKPKPTYSPADLISECATCPYCVEGDFGVVYTAPAWARARASTAPSMQNGDATNSNNMPNTTSVQNSPVMQRSDGDLQEYPKTSNPASPDPSQLQTPLSPLPSAQPTSRLSYPPNHPRVITTDTIRPDWHQHLLSMRQRLARKAANASALTQTFILPNGQRMLIRQPIDLDSSGPSTPTGSSAGTSPVVGSGSLSSSAPSPHYVDRSMLTGNSARRGSNRRTQMAVSDIEEMMLVEAIRQSIQAEEERKVRLQVNGVPVAASSPTQSSETRANDGLHSATSTVDQRAAEQVHDHD